MLQGPDGIRTREEFQRLLDSMPEGEVLELLQSEYQGPIKINRPVTIEGHGSTLSSRTGPVCQVDHDRVTLRNLKIEVTDKASFESDSEDGCALQILGSSNPTLDDIEVRGSVCGLPAEEGRWRHPVKLTLGDLACDKESRFKVRLYVPVDCKLVSGITDVGVEPATLSPGRNEVTVEVRDPPRGATLHGPLYLQTARLKRMIIISGGRAVESIADGPGDIDSEIILWEPSDWDQLGVTRRQSRTPPPSPQPPPTTTTSVRTEPPSADGGSSATPTPQSGSPPSRRVYRPVPSIGGVFSAAPGTKLESADQSKTVTAQTPEGEGTTTTSTTASGSRTKSGVPSLGSAFGTPSVSNPPPTEHSTRPASPPASSSASEPDQSSTGSGSDSEAKLSMTKKPTTQASSAFFGSPGSSSSEAVKEETPTPSGSSVEASAAKPRQLRTPAANPVKSVPVSGLFGGAGDPPSGAGRTADKSGAGALTSPSSPHDKEPASKSDKPRGKSLYGRRGNADPSGSGKSVNTEPDQSGEKESDKVARQASKPAKSTDNVPKHFLK